jgi:hypothetical protein
MFGIEVHACTRAIEVGQRLRQRAGALLPGLERHVHAALREDVDDRAQSVEHHSARGIAALVRDEAGVEGDQCDAVRRRKLRDTDCAVEVRIPPPVASHATRARDALER